ncbi:MAG: EF-P 5-aminopentanol modification-associated protein YfmF [Candidatus Izemoplasmatales bacterium]|jgi:predicted Zn-dependent peptidase
MRLITENLDGLITNTLVTDKFKSVMISYRFIAPFSEATLNSRALLPEVLTGATRKYPSRALLKQKLDGLYGMELATQTQKFGKQSVISFDLSFINGDYLPKDTDLIEEAFALLGEIVLNPKLVKGGFMSGLFELEKRNLSEELDSMYHDRAAYSFYRFSKIMFKDELFRLSPRGEVQTLSSLTKDRLYSEYCSLINEDSRELYVIGKVDEKAVATLARKYLGKAPAFKEGHWIDDEDKTITQVTDVRETAKLNQSRIIVGYRTNIRTNDPLFYPMVVLNTILGDTDQAKLFLAIREDQRMSYDIQTFYSGNKGVLFVFAGVDRGYEDQVLALIDEVIERLDQETITESDLRIAKEQLQKKGRESVDSPSALIDKTFVNLHLFRRDIGIDELLSHFASVSVADIIQAKKRLVKDTVFVYHDRGEG